MHESFEWQQLSELFESARSLPPEQRAALMSEAKLSDAMRAELESLLAHADDAERFFGVLQQVAASASSTALTSDSDAIGDAITDAADATHAIDVASMIGRQVGHYRIDAEIGRGGMGVVYRATDERLQRPVAIKLLHARLTTSPWGAGTGDDASEARRDHTPEARAKRKLLAEARASAALDHPNICTVYGVGETPDEIAYIAMAYYAGETLAAQLKRGPLPIGTAVNFAVQIARGLCAAHERGIVHRDVKPANVLVTDQGLLKLLDFGIARDLSATHARSTPTGFTPGTMCYMAPEQVTGEAVDARADLWSLGIVLYEMCAGTRPFTTRNAGGMLYDIVYTATPSLRAVRDEVPLALETIVNRLLAKDRTQRYADARELLHDLESVTADTSVVEAPPLVRPAEPPVAGPVSWRVVVLVLIGAAVAAAVWGGNS